jgi:hypothetical protein
MATTVLLLRFLRTDASRVESVSTLQAPSGLFEALESDECYLYYSVAADCAATNSMLRRALAAVAPAAGIVRLDPILDVPGASADIAAPFHYVVETDVLPEREAEFNRWYDSEHLPGLAAVPGTARASRYRNPETSPRYHACYDIATPATVGSPPWAAVRATPWSERVRPAFRNTKRTLFRRRAS